jgi:aldehyde dehydrogenase (NAD+)
MITYDKLYIGGRWVAPATDKVLEIRSPHDQSLVGSTPEASTVDIDRAVSAAREAFDHGPWPRMTPAERSAVIERFSSLYARRADEIARLITAQNGSASWFTGTYQQYLTVFIDGLVKIAAEFPWESHEVNGAGERTVVRREPIGVAAAIVPWNAPQQAALAKLIPALLAGCTVVLKPSPETPIDGMVLAEVFEESGFPQGVISIVPGGREAGEHLVSHPGVDKVSFTGSTAAGRRIAAVAGEQLKRVSLELGGKSAAIVLEDADLDAVVEGLRFATFANNGEACIAHTRVLAPRSRYDEIVGAIATMVEGITVGDPADPDTYIGPLVREDQHRRVSDYIDLGIEEGARVVTGGPGMPEGEGLEKGFYVRPTVFADVDNSMRIAQEEIFGPVLVVIPYEDEADAIRIANDSVYGLSGGVWAGDVEHGLEVARGIRAGTLGVNGAFADMHAPFGGYKGSGIGREYGAVGIGAFTEYKAIGLGAA